MDHPLLTLKEDHLAGKPTGIVSVCSSLPAVLQAAVRGAVAEDRLLLIEATANQVNQDGGYSGLTPDEFADGVRKRAGAAGLAENRLILGADHLGPIPWKQGPAENAMNMAMELVGRCVQAGYTKIHLDTSAPCADDPGPLLPVEVSARRAAALCRAAETAARAAAASTLPVYVIGEDVPPPGGGLEENEERAAASGGSDARPAVTDPAALANTVDQYRHAFYSAGMEAAWERVVAVVVQPGVEFGHHRAAVYRRAAAVQLSACHERLPGRMTFEIHSADYQPPKAVAQMVQDHFPIVKIGPCLTFAYREALFALAAIEDELPGLSRRSKLRQTMEELMTEDPGHWRAHYRGAQDALRFLRGYSLRDRIRYYWPHPRARQAVARLMENLTAALPPALLRQHLPDLFPHFEAHRPIQPRQIVARRIQHVLQGYTRAAGIRS